MSNEAARILAVRDQLWSSLRRHADAIELMADGQSDFADEKTQALAQMIACTVIGDLKFGSLLNVSLEEEADAI